MDSTGVAGALTAGVAALTGVAAAFGAVEAVALVVAFPAAFDVAFIAVASLLFAPDTPLIF